MRIDALVMVVARLLVLFLVGRLGRLVMFVAGSSAAASCACSSPASCPSSPIAIGSTPCEATATVPL